MPLPFFIAALLGKSAATAVAKGIAGKTATAAAKTAIGHHHQHGLGQKAMGKLAQKASDAAVDKASERLKKQKQDRST